MPAGQTFNFQTDPYSVALLGYQPIIRVDYQATQNLPRRRQVLHVSAAERSDPRNDSWVERHEGRRLRHLHALADRQLHGELHDLPRGVVGRQLSPSGRVLGHRRRSRISAATRCRSAKPPTASRPAWAGIPYIFPDATIMATNTLAYEILNNVNPDGVGRHARAVGAVVHLDGGRVANSPPNNIGPFGNFILDTRMSNINVSVTKLHGTHTFKFGYYYFNSNQRRGTGNFLGQISFQNDTNNPVDTQLPVRQRGARRVQLLRPDDAVGRRHVYREQPRVVRAGQLEGGVPPDARLRRAPGAPEAAVRRLLQQLDVPARGVSGRRSAAHLRRRLHDSGDDHGVLRGEHRRARSAHRRDGGAECVAADWDARAQFRQRAERDLASPATASPTRRTCGRRSPLRRGRASPGT